jgi:ABC-type uncharacterized transport system YnjBCD substrate-binding protein
MSMMMPEPGGFPPELMAAMGGGPPPGGGGGGSPADFLRDLIEHARAYQDVEQDPEDLAVVAKCIAALQQLMAKNQKEADAAVGAGPAAKYLRKQQGAGPAY